MNIFRAQLISASGTNRIHAIQTKVNLLSVEKASNDTWYWMKLWYVKAQEAYNRAVNILPGDETAKRIYAEISSPYNGIYYKGNAT